MGLMHNLFRKIDENVHRRRSSRSRPRSETLSNIEPLEKRIALTANVYQSGEDGETAGFTAIVMDESGDDLYLRQTLASRDGTVRPRLELADNPEFTSASSYAFSTNADPNTNNFQDLFVSLGVPNTHDQDDVAGANPTTKLPTADLIGGGVGTLPAGMQADPTWAVTPGTLGGSQSLGSSVITVRASDAGGAIGRDTIFVDTQYLFERQGGSINDFLPLVFDDPSGQGAPTTTYTLDFGPDDIDDMQLTGEVNLETGLVFLELRATGGGAYADVIDGTDFSFRYASPVIAEDPSVVTVAPGSSLDVGFSVDLPAPDSVVTINSPINSPNRGTAVNGLVELRATNVVVNAPVVANAGFSVLPSRFLNAANVDSEATADVFSSNVVNIDPVDAALVDVGAQVFGRTEDGRIIPLETSVVAVDPGGDITLSQVVTLAAGRELRFFNPSSSPIYPTTLGDPLVESARIVLDPAAFFDIQPGAVVGNQGTIETDTYIPLNTYVAAVNTVTGEVYLTRPVSLPAGVNSVQFFNPSTDPTLVESFEATASIQASGFVFSIADDPSSDIRDRGRLYVAGSSSLSGVGGGTAADIVVTTNSSDIVFEGDVTATNQSYFFETTVAETPFSFTTKNSADISTGNISATNLEVTLSNMSPYEAANSVVHAVDLDTTVTSMQVSAGSYASQNPPFLQPGPDNSDPITGPFPFAVTVRETDALTLNTDLSSGGPVAISTGGDLSLTASIESSNDLSFTSAGTITGSAELSTTNGQISLVGTGVNLTGLTQVLTAPFDKSSTDVSITATNGSVSLGQGVRAVNKIVIDQRSTTGSVQSNGLISAHDVQVFAEGDVDIDTSASFVDVSVASAVNGAANTARTVTIDSDRDSQFRISTAGGTANVSVLGVDNDNGTSGVVTDDIAALSLELRETGVLSATAPQGSIDVIAVTSDELVMGVAADLLQGNAANMQAAGSVEIRTTQSPVTVLDAAVAGQGELQVRAAATANLAGTYAQNTPGITPSTITPAANGSINGAALTASFGGLDATNNPLRFRDLVLLSNQTNQEENGVYQVINLGNASTPWQLRRYGLAETTSELPVGTRVYITDGDARGDTYRVNAYDNTINSTPLRVTSGTARSENEIAVRFATESILDGLFAVNGTITGTPLGAGVPLRINETAVQEGDLILVQFGAVDTGNGNSTSPSSVANGVYEVTTSTDAWVLTRYDNIELQGSPTVEEATVVVLEGFYRTSRFGGTFDVAYDGLGLVDLTIAEDTEIASAIGSYDPRDTTTLVVSTAGATNDSAGSLGKMLTLAQANEAEDLVGQNILQELSFGNVLGSVTGNTGTIVLQQELPIIEKPIVIDASQRYTLDASANSQVLVIDGSRITTSSESTFVTRGDEVNGLVLGEDASADVSNIFRPLPSTVSSLRFGGFEQGAAVVVDGASNVLLDNLVIGQDSNNLSQAVRYGIRVTGDSGLDGPVSIVGGLITSASIPTNSQLPASTPAVTPFLDGAGVLLDDEAQNVQIVGTTVGSSIAANLVGVLGLSINPADFGEASTFNSIGASEIGDFDTSTVLNLFTLTIPLLDAEGNAIDMDDVFIGQTVSASELPVAGTTIVAINKAARQVTLSEAAVSTNTTATITLGTPARTEVNNNFWGAMLSSGATRVVNSDIASNIYDGIFIGALDGNVDPFTVTIGSSTTAGSNSNAIFSNGRNGIRFAENILSSTQSGGFATVISIQGNYIGSAVGSAFVGNTQGSYFWEGGETINPLDTAFASLGYDSTTDTPPAPGYITGDELFNALIAPVTEGGDVDSEGNENADFVDGGVSPLPINPGGQPPPDQNSW